MKRLTKDFFVREDVIQISKDLLGKALITNINGVITSGIIIETEAYKAPEDKASHAYNNRRTNRTETMFKEGGIAYVYLCYGIHSLFNIVTNIENIPHAILIRAIKPLAGIDTILKRRNMQTLNHRVANGPGTTSTALGITLAMNGENLLKNKIWLEDIGSKISKHEILASPRIGIDYAEEYVNKPWRFRLKANKSYS